VKVIKALDEHMYSYTHILNLDTALR